MPWLCDYSCSCSSDDCYFTNSNSIDYGPHRHEYGIPPMYFVAMVQTLNVNFVIPAQPTLLFAVNLDETGRTRPTSFIIPGFFAIGISVIVGFIIKIILGY